MEALPHRHPPRPTGARGLLQAGPAQERSLLACSSRSYVPSARVGAVVLLSLRMYQAAPRRPTNRRRAVQANEKINGRIMSDANGNQIDLLRVGAKPRFRAQAHQGRQRRAGTQSRVSRVRHQSVQGRRFGRVQARVRDRGAHPEPGNREDPTAGRGSPAAGVPDHREVPGRAGRRAVGGVAPTALPTTERPDGTLCRAGYDRPRAPQARCRRRPSRI